MPLKISFPLKHCQLYKWQEIILTKKGQRFCSRTSVSASPTLRYASAICT